MTKTQTQKEIKDEDSKCLRCGGTIKYGKRARINRLGIKYVLGKCRDCGTKWELYG